MKVSVSSAKNLQVCELIHDAATQIISNHGSVALRILPDLKMIDFDYTLDKDEIDKENFTVMQCSPYQDEKTVGSLAYMFTEMVVDMWLKLGATKFMLRDHPDEGIVRLYWNQGFSKEDGDAYWNTSRFQGYILEGDFMSREWSNHEAFKGGKLQ